MIRTIGKCPVHPTVGAAPNAWETRVYTIKVVTPMFGGGVDPGVADPVTPIRVPTIRGHLRFWWRVTKGAGMHVEKLHKREIEVWGDTESPSPVVVEVTAQPASLEKREPKGFGFYKFGPEAYALFSARQNSASLTREGFHFGLRVTWPKHEHLQEIRDKENTHRRRENQELLDEKIEDISSDVETALWAWLSFGGIGGRTRRGCGALYLLSSDPKPPVASLDNSSIRVFEGAPVHSSDPALAAWASAVKAYQEFRQSFRGRKHEKLLSNGKRVQVPGRSKWPEPDSIRKMTGCALKRPSTQTDIPDDINTQDHTRPVVPDTILPAFPRAVLGLPVVFHFADGPGKGKAARPNTDPADVELVPAVLDENGNLATGTRMASPIITRPIFYDGEWRPSIVILSDPISILRGAYLVGKQAKLEGHTSAALSEVVHEAQLKAPLNYPSSPTIGHRSVLEAFVEFIKARSFQEVSL